jgi:hypothetical protein
LDIAIIAINAACSAIGSFSAGYALSAIQHRRSIRDAGISEIITQERLAKFEAVRATNGMFRNLSHDIMHARASRGHLEFFHNSAMKKVSRMREFARSEYYILGKNYVAEAHRATDIVGV